MSDAPVGLALIIARPNNGWEHWPLSKTSGWISLIWIPSLKKKHYKKFPSQKKEIIEVAWISKIQPVLLMLLRGKPLSPISIFHVYTRVKVDGTSYHVLVYISPVLTYLFGTVSHVLWPWGTNKSGVTADHRTSGFKGGFITQPRRPRGPGSKSASEISNDKSKKNSCAFRFSSGGETEWTEGGGEDRLMVWRSKIIGKPGNPMNV